MYLSRKDFLLRSASFAFTGLAFNSAFPSLGELEAAVSRIPRRRLGKTNEMLPMLGIGGYHLGGMSSAREADRLIQLAIDLGIRFIDTAHCYQGGYSEELMGKSLHRRRSKVFLMTKVHSRGQKGAMRNLEKSLTALKTDHIDLWQFHNVKYNSEVDEIFSDGGALQAALKARKQGKIRYIGITGHYDPPVLKKALRHHKYLDTIQIPINLIDAISARSFTREVLPLAVKRDVAVLAMKTLVKGKLVSRRMASAKECLDFVYSKPVSMLISGIDREKYLRGNIKIASYFQKMSLEEERQLLKRIKRTKQTSLEHYRK